MSSHVVLLFEPDHASTGIGRSIVSQFEQSGYEVIEAHNLSLATALLFVDRRVEAVVIDATDNRIEEEFAHTVRAIRPGLPLLTTPLLTTIDTEVQVPEHGPLGRDVEAG